MKFLSRLCARTWRPATPAGCWRWPCVLLAVADRQHADDRSRAGGPARSPSGKGRAASKRPIHIGAPRRSTCCAAASLVEDLAHRRRARRTIARSSPPTACPCRSTGPRRSPPARVHHHVGRIDRLADAGREVARRPQLSRGSGPTIRGQPRGPRRFTTTLKYCPRPRADSSSTRITRRPGASSRRTST